MNLNSDMVDRLRSCLATNILEYKQRPKVLIVIPMIDIITPEDEILIAAVITAIAQQTEPLPPIVVTQLHELGQTPPAKLNDSIQDFLEQLEHQPLKESVNTIEKEMLDRSRGKGAPPAKATAEHSAEIFNSFTSVTAAVDIRQAALDTLKKINNPTTISTST